MEWTASCAQAYVRDLTGRVATNPFRDEGGRGNPQREAQSRRYSGVLWSGQLLQFGQYDQYRVTRFEDFAVYL